ncbi:polysaccharide deacetylase family protein [Sporosarcina sp. NPDC096371]|uniref:polysaccharide deacetylase family protein n=1 Tax=Sporosarcina sp. NPDC096371 TaxID=3364530 RepID=UPI0037F9126A
MKKFYHFITLCTLIFLVFFVYESTFADKGRKYYEEKGQILWEINTDEKIIALTFDDGPHRKYTTEILDLLAEYDARATFFIVGEYAEKNPNVVSRMFEEGHELANHTYTHPLRSNVPNLLEEIRQTNETIYSISGFSPTLFRPVEGRYDDDLIDAVVKEGYKVVMWSWHMDTLDWKNPGVNKIVDIVLKGTKPGNVVLFHDGGGNREQTVKAIKKILPELKKQGYTFVTISELLEIQKASNNDKDNRKKIEGKE